MISILNVIEGQIVTEKTSKFQGKLFNTYAFEVKPVATKFQIKKAIEKFFNVKVDSVRTLVRKSQTVRFGNNSGRSKKTKTAYVRLAEGDEIEFPEENE